MDYMNEGSQYKFTDKNGWETLGWQCEKYLAIVALVSDTYFPVNARVNDITPQVMTVMILLWIICGNRWGDEWVMGVVIRRLVIGLSVIVLKMKIVNVIGCKWL